MLLKDMESQGVKQIKIKLIKSPIGKIPAHKATVKALGLRKIGQERVIDTSNKALLGMVKQIEYMLKIEVVNG